MLNALNWLIKNNDDRYKSREEFANDARLVFRNCDIFNEDDSDVRHFLTVLTTYAIVFCWPYNFKLSYISVHPAFLFLK